MKPVLQKLLSTLIVLAAIVAILGVVGMTLPREHVATSMILTRQPAESVWAVISDPAGVLTHWSDLTRAERLADQDGMPVWEQDVDGFTMRLRVEEAQPPTRMVTRILADSTADFGGTWTYVVERTDGDGSRVIITEQGWVSNPWYRLMARLIGYHASLDGYLGALGQRLGTPTQVWHVMD